MSLKTVLIAAALFALPASAQEKFPLTGEGIIYSDTGHKQTCAGHDVWVIPTGRKADKRMREVYGPSLPSYAPISATPELILGRTVSKSMERTRGRNQSQILGVYLKGRKHTRCDADGKFAFSQLKAGDYYLIVPVFSSQNAAMTGMPSATNSGNNQRRNTSVEYSNSFSGGTLATSISVDPSIETIVPMIMDLRTPSPEQDADQN